MKMNILFVTYRRCFRVVCKSFSYSRLLDLSKTLLIKNKNILILGIIPVIPAISAQSLSIKEGNNDSSKIDSNKEAYKSDGPKLDDEKTPWERVKAIYETDEFGNFSKELVTTLNSCYMALVVGFVYGGVQRSRNAYIDFMERNQATIFENHIDAKRKLQNHVTIHFGKGAFQWAWRLSAFTGGFVLTFLSLHAYRGTTSFIDYAISGAVIGAVMRLKLGPPGIIIGGAVGGVLGFVCGLTNQSILSLFGVSYDEILALQYKVDRDRNMLVEHRATRDFEDSGQVPKVAIDMLKAHENKTTDI